jgi:primosomal protein N' (replication factor Y) (superfamily II helicase)
MESLFQPDGVVVTGRYAQVAPERGMDLAEFGLTYAIPQGLDVQPGDRVVMPLGRGDKRAVGYVVGLEDKPPEGVKLSRIKALIGRDQHGVSVPEDLVGLAKWIAGYYCSPLGMVLSTMLPAAVKRAAGVVKRVEVGLGEQSLVTNSGSPDNEKEKGVVEGKKEAKLSKAQVAVLEAAKACAEAGEAWIGPKALADRAGVKTVGAVKQLLAKGLLVQRTVEEVSAGWGHLEIAKSKSTADLALSLHQRAAFADVLPWIDRQEFKPFLLHGVTGSGKTEVYLRLIERVVAATGSGGWAIMLVPEISLTPQTASRFYSRFGDRVAVMHSGLTAVQRHDQWNRIQSGRTPVVVGARSAIFAPVVTRSDSGARLPGLIIVDEEHEHSYKQDQVPRYNARDVAVRRGQMLGVPVVLGSATPSLETYQNAGAGDPKAVGARFGYLSLPERVVGDGLPKVQIVDMVSERKHRKGIHLLSARLESALQSTLGTKGQAILLLNRRGYANYIACPDHACGWTMGCEHCDTTMVYHKDGKLPLGGLVRCHHCEAEQILPATCPVCSKKTSVFGLGTQRVEEEIKKKFPEAKMLRMDSDTMRAGKDYQASLDAFATGEYNLLVGTQMIAKGLDFPNVRLVGVVSADTSLHMPDFRASERTFSLIAQVAGRAGRGDSIHPALVVVQTYCPDDAVIQLACKHDFKGFAARELLLRQEAGLPPFGRMARVVIRHTELEKCHVLANKVAAALAEANQVLDPPAEIRGPNPCAVGRIAEYYRIEILILAKDAAALQRLLTKARNSGELHAGTTMAVDVDPVSLL